MSTKPEKTYRCDVTGQEVVKSRLPMGWKVIDGKTYSAKGWKQLYDPKGLKLAIGWPRITAPPGASPDEVAAAKTATKAEQDRLRLAVRAGLKQARDIFNWYMHEFYSQDRPRLDENGKLPALTVPSLYQKAKTVFPLDTYTADLLAAAEFRARKIFKANRWAYAAGRQGKQISFRRHPYVVRAASVNLYLDAEQKPRMKVTICRERFDLAIVKSARKQAPGHDNRVQWAMLVKALQDGLPYGECMFSMDRYGNVFVVVVVTLPVRKRQEATGTLHVRSTKEELILALNTKNQRLWAYNADQLIGWKFAHRRALQRLAEDTKAEDRPVPSFAAKRNAMVNRFRNRVDTTVKQVTARIVNYALRKRFATLELDLSEQAFFPRFDFGRLERLVAEKCHFEGIEFISRTKDQPEEVAAESMAESVT